MRGAARPQSAKGRLYRDRGRRRGPLRHRGRRADAGGSDITVVDAIDGFCDGKGSSVSPDWSGPGLYRFTGELSLQMPETKPSEGACNTDAPGWLNGTHPSVEDGYAMREVCFAYGTEDCNWSVDVGVVDCGAFFLYDLPEAPLCDLRFCGE